MLLASSASEGHQPPSSPCLRGPLASPRVCLSPHSLHLSLIRRPGRRPGPASRGRAAPPLRSLDSIPSGPGEGWAPLPGATTRGRYWPCGGAAGLKGPEVYSPSLGAPHGSGSSGACCNWRPGPALWGRENRGCRVGPCPGLRCVTVAPGLGVQDSLLRGKEAGVPPLWTRCCRPRSACVGRARSPGEAAGGRTAAGLRAAGVPTHWQQHRRDRRTDGGWRVVARQAPRGQRWGARAAPAPGCAVH